MQIFVVHEFGPPSPGVEPPLSGNVNGGNMKGFPESPAGADPSSPVVAASSDATLESPSGAALPPPLPLPPLPLPPLEPEPEEPVTAPPPDDGWLPDPDPPADVDLVDPSGGVESGDVAQPAAPAIVRIPTSQIRRAKPSISRGNRFTRRILTEGTG